MEKKTIIDPVTGLIIAATIAVMAYLALGYKSELANKIVILDSDPVTEIMGNGEISPQEASIRLDLQAEKLAEQGYIVLRSEVVRAAPPHLYVDPE